MFKLKESKKLNRKILVNEDKETYKIIRVKDKENLKTLYDNKSSFTPCSNNKNPSSCISSIGLLRSLYFINFSLSSLT